VAMDRAGFYPRGGGRIHARIQPCAGITPFQGITTEAITSARIISGSAGLPGHVAQRMTDHAANRLAELGLTAACDQETWEGGPGCMLGIEVPTLPVPSFFFALGERGKPAELVADEAVQQFEAFWQTRPLGVDEHSADQLLMPLAFAEGSSQFRIAKMTSHLRTNADIIGHFLDRSIRCEGADGDSGCVVIG